MRLALSALALCALAPALAAQPLWRAAPGAAVSLDALTAYDDTFVGGPDVNSVVIATQVITSSVALSARVPVGERLAVRAELPLAVLLYADQPSRADGSVNTVAVGNPMIGADVRLPTPSGLDALTVGAELRLPLANGGEFSSYGDASFVGGLSDRLRFEAYEGGTASLLARVAATLAPTPGSRVTVALAPVVSYTTVDDPERPGDERPPVVRESTNVGVLGSAVGTVRLGRASVGGGLLGRYEPRGGALTYERSYFADGTLHAALEGLPVRPGVQLVLPLAPRYAGTPGAVLGLSLDVPLR